MWNCSFDLLSLLISTPSWTTALSPQKGLCDSVELWAVLCWATRDRQVVVNSSSNTVPQRRKPQTAPALPWEPQQAWEGKKTWHQETSPPWTGPSVLRGRAESGCQQRQEERSSRAEREWRCCGGVSWWKDCPMLWRAALRRNLEC